MCFTIGISFSRPSLFLLVFSMGNRKCTAWLSSLTVLCYLCICTCMFQGKLQYIQLLISDVALHLLPFCKLKQASIMNHWYIQQGGRISVGIARGLEGWTPSGCFLNPPNTLSNYALGGSAIYYMHTINVTILVRLWLSRSLTPQLCFHNSNTEANQPGGESARHRGRKSQRANQPGGELTKGRKSHNSRQIRHVHTANEKRSVSTSESRMAIHQGSTSDSQRFYRWR